MSRDELLTIAEVAHELRLSRGTMYRLLRGGMLPTVYVGPKGIRIRRSALTAYLDAHATPGVTRKKGP